MEELLIKVKLNKKCDQELVDFFEHIPKRRRAEQIRKLALDGLRSKLFIRTTQPESSPKPNHNNQLDDDSLFENDMNNFL